jgi:single-strand DNA-binding protein
MVNKVTLIGRLTRDPEVRQTSGGVAVVSLGLATNSYSGKGDERKEYTEFHKVTLFGRVAESVATYLRKGSLVHIEGTLRTQKWTAQDGGDRSEVVVIANEINFLDKRSDG